MQRTPAQISVTMHYLPLGLISGVTRNISRLGMFVQTNAIILSTEETVDLNFRFPDNDGGENHSMEARIIHSNERGVGLQFLNFQLTLPSGGIPVNRVPFPS